MNSGSNGWFIALPDGQARGPYERAELMALRAAGQLAEDALVWTLDSAEWVPVKRALPPSTASQLLAVAALDPTAARKVEAASSPTIGRVAPKPAKSEARTPAKSTAAKTEPKPRGAPIPGTAAHAPRAAVAPTLPVDQLKLLRFVHGVRRLLARNIDVAILGGLGWALASRALLELGTYMPPFPQAFERFSFPVLAILAMLAVPLEAVLLGISGYTPGKFALGIRVVGRGQSLGLVRAFKRALDVLVRGQAMLVPPFSLIAYGMGLHALVNKGRTNWDERLGTDVEHAPMTTNRWWVGLALLALGYGALRDDVFSKLVWAVVP